MLNRCYGELEDFEKRVQESQNEKIAIDSIGKKLSPKQNKSVIASVNHEIFKFVGNQRPDASMCR